MDSVPAPAHRSPYGIATPRYAAVERCRRVTFGRLPFVLAVVPLAGVFSVPAARAQEPLRNAHTTVVMMLGRPEEGARLFTMIRLLPPDHPEAIGHDLPTLQTLHPLEVEVLVHLGEQVGLGLRSTLERHKKPTIAWPYYPQFRLPPVEQILAAPLERRAAHDAPVAGLRAVAFVDRFPVAVLIDTRRLSLEDRGMRRATTSGLDITRARLEQALGEVAARLPAEGVGVVAFIDEPN